VTYYLPHNEAANKKTANAGKRKEIFPSVVLPPKNNSMDIRLSFHRTVVEMVYALMSPLVW
jgi:hypothetical protein